MLFRRKFLQLSALAGAGVLAAGSRAFAAPAGSKVRHCVLLFMHGGPSQLDTFDPKPESANGGGLRAIESSVSGLRVSEHLPQLAKRMHELALVRSLSSREGNHDRARYLLHTGFVPQGGVTHPGLGSHGSRRAPENLALPAYVAIDSPGQGAGYLGAAHAPFVVPNATRPVRNLAPARPLGEGRFERRVDAWRVLERGFAEGRAASSIRDQRDISERAVAMVHAPERQAFDLSTESAATLGRYGGGRFGRGCLMARRLIEQGVPFVEVGLRGWDTHEDNLERCRDLCRALDGAMSALIDDLHASGKWQETLILWVGDFGRTPRINGRGGRDHFPAVGNVLLGGGGIREGVVLGATSPDGEEIVDGAVTVPDVFATVCERLGIPAAEVHMTPSGRPVTTVDASGRVLDALV